MNKEVACNLRTDPVDRLVKDLSAEETVDWLIEYKGLPESSRENVVTNLKGNLNAHRLRGRLDHWPIIATLVQIWLSRRPLPAAIEPIPADVKRAVYIAQLWRAGKMIGGDDGEIRDTLLAEVERLHGTDTAKVPA
ncbi:MAG: hypothetical protein V4706_02780 [Pseudomonadota bacterium]